jgi:predicted nucleic acid-binding protein
MIVVDTSVLFPFFNEMDGTQWSHQVHEKDSAWIVPALWKDEYANVLAKFARKAKMPWPSLRDHYQSVLDCLQPCEIPVDHVAVLKLAVDHKVSAYDAQFAWLAQQHEVFLVTEDQELIKQLPSIALSMKHFCK